MGLEHALQLLVSLLLLAFILTLQDLVLSLRLGPVALHDVVVIVSALECGLHARQLVLHAVQLHTSLLTRLSNLADGLFGLAKFQIDTFVLVRQLLRESILQTGHQRL